MVTIVTKHTAFPDADCPQLLLPFSTLFLLPPHSPKFSLPLWVQSNLPLCAGRLAFPTSTAKLHAARMHFMTASLIFIHSVIILWLVLLVLTNHKIAGRRQVNIRRKSSRFMKPQHNDPSVPLISFVHTTFSHPRSCQFFSSTVDHITPDKTVTNEACTHCNTSSQPPLSKRLAQYVF